MTFGSPNSRPQQMLLLTHHLGRLTLVGGHRALRKDTDYETSFRCAGGIGVLREEVWVDEKEEEIVRYNLAFLLPHCMGTDNGRIMNATSWEK